MRDLSDSTRDVRPRTGSPLWVHMTVVTAAGLGALAFALSRLGAGGIAHLLGEPLLWVVAALALIGELRPIVTPGKSGPDSGVASLTFCFAALLYWGLPVAVPLMAGVTVSAALFLRHAAFRAAFNAAQATLSLGAASLVLGASGVHPAPLAPWAPSGERLPAVALAAGAYFCVNFVLVGVAVALHSHAPVAATLRRALPYQAFVNVVLLSAAPLVAVVMGRSVLLVLLFLLPLTAVYLSAAMSVQREHQALHDELTGLPNRALLLRRTGQAMAEAAGRGGRAAFLLLDLDRFKEVNDTLGHPVGDALLRQVGQRLAHSVRPGDVVARLGGDEFAVLLPSVRDAAMAREVSARLRAAIAEPIRMEGMTFEIEASIGIALYPDDAAAVEVLLQRADVAMYVAKERRSGVEPYSPDSDRNSPARLSLLGDLRQGIDRGELELHYQPKVLLCDGRCAGMEALLRWRHPQRGLVLPAEFLATAEQSYLMRALTSKVMDSVMGQAARWRRAGLAVPVSFNLSGRDLLDARLPEEIGRRMGEHGLPPGEVIVEISEQVLAGGPSHAAATLASLSDLGIPLSLDDFGTGYAPLAQLKRQAVSEVKIASSFVGWLLDSPDNELIVRSLVEMAHALGIRCVAEGVETAATAEALRRLGCDAAQGTHLAGPMDVPTATAWLSERLPRGRLDGPPSPRRAARQPAARQSAGRQPAGRRG